MGIILSVLGVVVAVLTVGLLLASYRTITDFYLYFADEAQARPVVEYLKSEGFHVESRRSADESQWLVQATKAVSSLHLASLEETMASLAASHGGEYDGYERAVAKSRV